MLQGKICLITGASRGIGRETASLFVRQGATVVLAARSADKLEALAAELKQKYAASSLLPMACDVSAPDQVKKLFNCVFEKFGGLDVLVANAGALENAPIGMVSDAQIDRVFRTNTYSLFYCAQYASRLMNRHGGGSIIAMSSIVGTSGSAGQSVYAASKSAIVGIVRSLAKELASKQIRVNALAPGLIDTEMTNLLRPDARATAVSAIGLGRIGTTEDVANAALFFASDLSRYITGQILGVDGGLVL